LNDYAPNAQQVRPLTLFLCGDVMTGRGIDQVLPHSSEPTLYEPYVRDARQYVALAERAHGPIPRPVDWAYIWGDALAVWERMRPDIKLINLETSVTQSDTPWPGKAIHYRMHPANIACLTVAGINCCTLANNHTLDWGYDGLSETLATLAKARIQTAGAGPNLTAASAPVPLAAPDILAGKGHRRVLVLAYGSASSGIPLEWAATETRPGVQMIAEKDPTAAQLVGEQVRRVKRDGDIVIASIHWGSNWGFEVPPEQRTFAHRLIDEAGVDVVHGHSSHHVKGIEVYQGKPILYGCGDFLTDYEGIKGYEAFRGDLSLMYFVQFAPTTGKLAAMHMMPTHMERFQVRLAAKEDALWLCNTLNREGKAFETRVERGEDNMLTLRWG
jgi:poly-gamma-glutamate capsule biosynthesis protein CapA/YwtB (metallophosphatase superfamily)